MNVVFLYPPVSRAIASIAAELTFPIIAATEDCDVAVMTLFLHLQVL